MGKQKNLIISIEFFFSRCIPVALWTHAPLERTQRTLWNAPIWIIMMNMIRWMIHHIWWFLFSEIWERDIISHIIPCSDSVGHWSPGSDYDSNGNETIITHTHPAFVRFVVYTRSLLDRQLGDRLRINMSSYPYRDRHHKDDGPTTVVTL